MTRCRHARGVPPVRRLAALAVLGVACAPGARPAPERTAAPAFVVDGHNDVLARFLRGARPQPADSVALDSAPAGQTDLRRWRAGGVGASFVTVAALDTADRAGGLAATVGFFRDLAARHPDRLAVAATTADVRRAAAAARIALLPALEGADQLGSDSATVFPLLDRARALGVRAVGLTWNRTNALGDAALDGPRHGGLSPLGRAVVRRLNALGIVVDLSHAAEATALAAIEASRAPVILSHSSAAALCPTPRNASDRVLRRVAANGGVVMVTFVPYLTTPAHAAWYEAGEREWAALRRRHGGDGPAARRAMEAWEAARPAPPVGVSDVADHVEHVRRVAGVEHVGLGSDFDGMYSHVTGLEDVGRFPVLLAELRSRGWTERDLARLAGGNAMRVLEAVERAARAAER